MGIIKECVFDKIALSGLCQQFLAGIFVLAPKRLLCIMAF
jgi:hypothetical protein